MGVLDFLGFRSFLPVSDVERKLKLSQLFEENDEIRGTFLLMVSNKQQIWITVCEKCTYVINDDRYNDSVKLLLRVDNIDLSVNDNVCIMDEESNYSNYRFLYLANSKKQLYYSSNYNTKESIKRKIKTLLEIKK